MSLKIVFLVVCSFVAVNSFTALRSDERKSQSDLFPLTGYEVKSRGHGDYQSNEQGQRQTEDEEGSMLDRRSGSSYLNRGQYSEERPEGLGGQKLKLKYSSSSSSSSEEHSSESHEIKKVEKQYHDNKGYYGGKNHYQRDQSQPRNHKMGSYEAPDLQNAIDKDM